MNDSISSLNSRLWHAAALGQLELVRELLDAGAEIDSVDANSQTAAHLTASNVTSTSFACSPLVTPISHSPIGSAEHPSTLQSA